jgi:NADH-quinone oxidoreductase subunit N
MNFSYLILEILVVALGLGLLLAGLWTPREHKKTLGYMAAAFLASLLVGTFFVSAPNAVAFGGTFVLDDFALFFKRFFLLAAIIVLVITVAFSDRVLAGISEYYALIVFALAGMLFVASANDFILMFVSIELVTISFYVLVSFQRHRLAALEAGIKYLILSALSTAFLVFGIALIFGTAGVTRFDLLAQAGPALGGNPIFLLGLLFVLVGLGFKIAAFPFQIWAPDVYQGAPVPTTAFLAVGSKAAGVLLILRILFSAIPEIAQQWGTLLIVISALTILYGNLCAIPQRNLKRLLGYSSIAHAGYILLGVAALSQSGAAAVLYYLAAYLFTVLAAFAVITIVTGESEDVTVLAGLNQRSPLLAATLTLSMVSLAGVPPAAGFFGKFLLLKSVVEQGPVQAGYYWLAAIAIVGVLISLYYYFGVVRAIYWSKTPPDLTPIRVTPPMQAVLYLCMAGIFYLGLFPNAMLNMANRIVEVFAF